MLAPRLTHGCFVVKISNSVTRWAPDLECEDTYSCIHRLVGEKGSKKNTFELNVDAKVQKSVRAQERAGTTVLKLSSLSNLFGMAKEMLAAGDDFRKLIEGPNKLKHELGYDPSFLTMDGRPCNLDYFIKQRDDSPSVASASTSPVINGQAVNYDNLTTYKIIFGSDAATFGNSNNYNLAVGAKQLSGHIRARVRRLLR